MSVYMYTLSKYWDSKTLDLRFTVEGQPLQLKPLYCVHAAGGQEFHKVPVEKMFMFHQPRTDYSIHPQITTSSDTEDSSSGIVSDQPRLRPGGPTKAESVATSEQSLRGSVQSLQSSSGGMCAST